MPPGSESELLDNRFPHASILEQTSILEIVGAVEMWKTTWIHYFMRFCVRIIFRMFSGRENGFSEPNILGSSGIRGRQHVQKKVWESGRYGLCVCVTRPHTTYVVGLRQR